MNGVVVPDATVAFTVDGGASKACHHYDEDNFECGDDVTGHFVITASHAGMTGMAEADVSRDGCHVQSVTRIIKLAP
jgi:hypothetical protein